MLLPHGAIVAIVDGEKLELYRNSGNDAAPELLPVEPPMLDAHNKDAGARHHSSSANPAGRQLDEDAHAAAVTDWLNQQVLGHKIEHLVVIAAPRTLGEMRRRYDKALEAALIGELHKEMIGRTGQDVLAALHGAEVAKRAGPHSATRATTKYGARFRSATAGLISAPIDRRFRAKAKPEPADDRHVRQTCVRERLSPNPGPC